VRTKKLARRIVAEITNTEMKQNRYFSVLRMIYLIHHAQPVFPYQHKITEKSPINSWLWSVTFNQCNTGGNTFWL